MSSLVEDDFTRASAFFALAFVMMTVGGFLIGDPRLGVEWGLGLGAAFGAFAYFFLQPTSGEEHAEDEGDGIERTTHEPATPTAERSGADPTAGPDAPGEEDESGDGPGRPVQ